MRLTLIFTAMLAIVIAAAGLTLLLRLRAELRSTIDNALLSRAEVIRAADKLAGLGLPAGSLIERDESFAQIIGADGGVEEASGGLAGVPLVDSETLERLRELAFFQREVKIGDEELPARLLAVNLEDRRVLVVGSSLEDQQEAVNTLAGLLAIGGPAVVGLAAMIVWSLTGAALKPVERLRQEADALSVSEVGRPLALPETEDEIARLGRSLNGLLARLAEALETERRFVDDASHELRTPVATLKAELELALSGSSAPREMRSAVERALADADYLALLTEDLLVLARAEDGSLPIRRTEVDLAELVKQIAAGFTHRAESQGISINVDVVGTHFVDPLRMRQVLSNLLDNALRHCGAGGSVSVRSVREDGTLILQVEDTGSGFPPEVLSSSFEPPVRSGRERGRLRGEGLGLPIVKAIVEAHGGSVELGNGEHGGARLSLRFPSAEEV